MNMTFFQYFVLSMYKGENHYTKLLNSFKNNGCSTKAFIYFL